MASNTTRDEDIPLLILQKNMELKTIGYTPDFINRTLEYMKKKTGKAVWTAMLAKNF